MVCSLDELLGGDIRAALYLQLRPFPGKEVNADIAVNPVT
jgi:hypothetical protein